MVRLLTRSNCWKEDAPVDGKADVSKVLSLPHWIELMFLSGSVAPVMLKVHVGDVEPALVCAGLASAVMLPSRDNTIEPQAAAPVGPVMVQVACIGLDVEVSVGEQLVV